MRRAAPAIAATLAGLGLLTQFETTPSSSTLSTTGRSAPATTAPRGASRDGGDDDGPPPTTAPRRGAPSTTTTTAPSGSGTAGDKTVDGPVAENRFGPVQVEVVVSGGKLVDVKALQLPSDRERSAWISQQAEPMLHDEVMQAHSAKIDIISGATYTSRSYIQSLQAALDKAGL